jgi:hypothetical protein
VNTITDTLQAKDCEGNSANTYMTMIMLKGYMKHVVLTPKECGFKNQQYFCPTIHYFFK